MCFVVGVHSISSTFFRLRFLYSLSVNFILFVEFVVLTAAVKSYNSTQQFVVRSPAKSACRVVVCSLCCIE